MRRAISLLLTCLLVTAAPAAEEDLFRAPLESFARISPDGRTLAVIVNDNDTQRVDRIDLESGNRHVIFESATLGASESAIPALHWVDNDTIILGVVELTDGIARLSDTRHRRHILVIDIGDDLVTRYIETDGVLIDALPESPDEVLYGRPGSTSLVYRIQTSKLHRLGQTLSKTARVDGGQFSRNNRVAEVDGVALRWVTDSTGAVRAVLRWHPDDGYALMMRDSNDSEWQPEYEWSDDKKKKDRQARDREDDPVYLPEALVAGSSDFIVVSDDDNGRNGVYRYNYKTREKQLIYQHPAAEIVGVGLTADNTDVTWVGYFEDGVIKFYYPDGAYRDVAARLAKRFPRYEVHVSTSDAAEELFFFYLRSPIQPGRAFVYNRPDDSVQELFSVMPWIDEPTLSQSTSATVQSHNLEIEYFLTLPRSDQKVPLVVYPHGGPWGVADRRVFDPAVQYLASRGMAILQVNYRGSGGYGEEFLKEGQGQFGRLMIDDIESALASVLKNPAIDSDKICVVGHSYGGYAALMLAARAANRYSCAASLAGVTDLGLLLGSYREDTADVLLPLLTNGDLPASEQYDDLKRLSPLYNAEKLDLPLFLAHGDDDRRVDVEHGFRLRDRLRLLDKPVTWQQLEGMGHNFETPRAAYEYYRSLADFIESTL